MLLGLRLGFWNVQDWTGPTPEADQPTAPPASDLLVLEATRQLPQVPNYRYVAPFAVAPADNPPFGLLETLYEPFIVDPGQPILPRKFIPRLPVDNPPFGLLETLYEPFIVDPGLPIQPRYYPQQFISGQVPVQNYWLSTVLQTWQPPDPQAPLPRKLSPGIPGQSVDNPTPNLDEDINFSSVLGLWQPGDPWPTQQRKLSPGIPGQSVDFPPFSGRPQPPTNQPDPWVYTYTGNQPYGLPIKVLYGLSVDNPPRLRQQVFLPPEPFLQPQRGPLYPQPFVVTVSQPFVEPWLASVVASWQVPDPFPILPEKLTPPSTDNPPFTSAGRIGREAIQGWQPPDPLPTQPHYQVVQPFISVQYAYTTPWLWTVMLAWQPPDPQPTIPPRNVLYGLSVDNPPRFRIQVPPYWEAERLPVLPKQLSPGIPGQSVDNPPTKVVERVGIQLWQPGDPSPVLPKLLSPGIPGMSVDNPPQLTWAYRPILFPPEPPPKPWQPLYLAQPFVSANPPFSGRDLFSYILRTWQEPDPQPRQPVPLAIQPFFAPQNPPFSHLGRNERDNIVSQWQPLPWNFMNLPPLGGRFQQEGPAPVVVPANFTVSGPSVEDLFGPRDGVSWEWGGGVSKRTV